MQIGVQLYRTNEKRVQYEGHLLHHYRQHAGEKEQKPFIAIAIILHLPIGIWKLPNGAQPPPINRTDIEPNTFDDITHYWNDFRLIGRADIFSKVF